jgi:hypothetical protein
LFACCDGFDINEKVFQFFRAWMDCLEIYSLISNRGTYGSPYDPLPHDAISNATYDVNSKGGVVGEP